jgi:hypothetical protein
MWSITEYNKIIILSIAEYNNNNNNLEYYRIEYNNNNLEYCRI